MIENFLGIWELEPEKNVYQTSTAPKKGVYKISHVADKNLLFQMEWTDQHDLEHEASYTSTIDGKKYDYDSNHIDQIESKFTSHSSMETITYKDGKVTSIGKRELINNNSTMLVSQITLLPDGREINNKSVYKKQL